MQKIERDFIEMINSHRGIIYKVVHMYVHDAEDREDLFQEIIFQLWRSLPSFRGESKASTWMYRIALNTAISHFRNVRRKPDQLSLSAFEFQIPDINERQQLDESLNMLHDAIQQLSRIEKAVIILYLEDKSYQEISEIMGISQSNVGVKINRIKSKLEKIIKKVNV
jgi:RNA polymerase sigma factor (sigma-70 family)